jgi:Leucine-rich repeat (LRR) protein
MTGIHYAICRGYSDGMDPAISTPMAPGPRRFSIRLPRPLWIGLAAGVLIVAAIGLHFGLKFYRERAAIREIERLKGTAIRAEERPDWLRGLVGNDATDLSEDVVRLDLSNSKVADGDLAWLTALPNLEILRLANTKLTDKGLIHLQTLGRLRELELGGTNVTDAGIGSLKPLKGLRRIGLEFTPVTGAGLESLSGLAELRELDLSSTPIGDEDLARLTRLPNLRQITLVGTSVTDSGIAELQRAFPKAIVMK